MKRTLLVVAFILAGCVSTPTAWDRRDRVPVQGEFDRDRAVCNYDAKRVFNDNINSPLRARFLGEETYTSCMEAKGWVPRK